MDIVTAADRIAAIRAEARHRAQQPSLPLRLWQMLSFIWQPGACRG
jgi:hypothetical protein